MRWQRDTVRFIAAPELRFLHRHFFAVPLVRQFAVKRKEKSHFNVAR